MSSQTHCPGTLGVLNSLYIAGLLKGADPDDLFCFSDGTRLHRHEIAGKVFKGEFKILFVGTREYREAVQPITLRD